MEIEKNKFEDQYFEKFGFPMIMCNSHKNYIYEFINLNKQNLNKLACAQCIINDRLNPDFLINVKEIFSNNPNNIIQNWPPLSDLSIYQRLMIDEVQQSKKSLSIQEIDTYFDKLKVDILKQIDEHQKRILMHINIIEENRQRVIDLYNQISNKEEIKNEFLNNKNNLSQLQKYLKQTITTNQSQQPHNQQNIINALDIFTKSSQQFQFQYIENIFKQLLIDIKSIDTLNPVLTIEQQFSLKFSDQKQDQDNNKVQNFKINDYNEANQDKKEINEIDLQQTIKFIQSNFSSLNNQMHIQPISFKKGDNNYFELENKYDFWQQVIIDQELIPEKKYQIQVNIKQSNGTYKYMQFGILPISKKDEAGWNQQLSLCTLFVGNGIDELESGQHISEIIKDVKQISFQICLKEQILRCLSIVNNTKNINSQQKWDKSQQNEKYYFYIGMAYHQILQIQQFKITEQFDQW